MTEDAASCGAARAVSGEALLEVVRRLYVELHRSEPAADLVALGSSLENDLGFDSLARVELLLRLEQRFGVHLPDTTLATAQTVSDLLRAVSRTAAATPAAERARPAAPVAHRQPQTSAASGAPSEAATLQDVLAWRVKRQPAATHLILLEEAQSTVLSFQALHDGAERTALGLQRLGIDPGSTVALMLPTGLDYFFAFFGVLMTGAIPVPIYPPMAAQLEEHVHRHDTLLNSAGVGALITVDEAKTVARLLRARVSSLRHVLSVRELMQQPRASVGAATPRSAVSGDSIALLQYTSGSTGAPKGVVLKHRHVLANIRAMRSRIGATESDVFVSWLPLYHDMGLIGAWLGALYFGCPLVIMPPTAFLTRPHRWLRAIQNYGGTLSGGPNFAYELCARRVSEVDIEGLDLSSWRMAFNAAEPVLPDTLERFQSRFARHGFRAEAMSPAYGLAEAAVGLAFPPPGRGPIVDCVDRAQLMSAGLAVPVSVASPTALHFVSSGRPLPGYQVRVIDAAGSEVPERVEGAVQFAGPSATDSYYRNAAATTELVHGIWRNTGDRAYMANGEIYLTGRAKDIIIRRGRHIYPEEIERSVAELEGVRKGCVVAFGSIAPSTATEKLVIVAETRELDATARSQLTRSINECVVGCTGEPAEEVLLATPHTVLKTSSGKLRRAATRSAYEDGSLGRPRAGAARQLWRLGLESIRPALRTTTRTAGRVGYGVYAWAAFLAIAVPVICTALFLNSDRTWRLSRRALRAITRVCGISFSVIQQADIDLSAPHVVVVNHCSYVDSLFVVALLPATHSFVADFAWQNLPLLHAYLRRLGTTFIDRSSPLRSVADLQQLKAALAQGRSLVVFPEGTFTRESGLRPFHLGAFRVAVDAGVSILPIALRGTRSLLRDGQWLPRRMEVSAVVGGPLSAFEDGDAFAAALRLRDAARAQILRYCGEPELL
ncbi:MAG: AMP-binding protein [Steroidobacteraceae bacterium]